MNSDLICQVSSNNPSLSVNDSYFVGSAGPSSGEEGRFAMMSVNTNPEQSVAPVSLSPDEVEYSSLSERDVVANNGIETQVKCDEEQLIRMVCSRNYEGVERCLAEGANPNCKVDDISILTRAALDEEFDIVKILLQHGANPDDLLREEPGFAESAFVVNQLDIAQILLDNGHAIDDGEMLRGFKNAISNCYADFIEFCLKNGVDVHRLELDCSPIVNLVCRSSITANEKCSLVRSLRVMVNYGADVEKVIFNGERRSLFSLYFDLERLNYQQNYRYHSYCYSYDRVRELLLFGLRISDEVLGKIDEIDRRDALIALARRLDVPSGLEMLPKELLVPEIIGAMERIRSDRVGTLKNLSLGAIASRISCHSEPDKAVESLPLPVIVKNRLKEFVGPGSASSQLRDQPERPIAQGFSCTIL